MRRVLHRYIFFDLVKVLVLATAALTFFLALVYALSELRDRGLGPLDAIQLVLCFVPVMLVFAMPIAALLTTTLVYGRLSSDNEITACRASGVSMVTVLWPVLVLGLCIGAVNFVLFDRVIPWSRAVAQSVGMDNMERIFLHSMETRKEFKYQKNLYIRAQHTEGHMLYGVVMSYTEANGQRYEAMAPAAYVRFYPPDQVPDSRPPAPPPPAPAAAGGPGEAPEKKRAPTREEVALSPECQDTEVIPRGRAIIQLFGVYAADPGKTRKMIGNPSFWRSLKEVHTRRPSQMTLAELGLRYAHPETTFDYCLDAANSRELPKAERLVREDKTKQRIRAGFLAEIHSRYATMVSCVLLVGLGAALGVFFRHGHILTAFAVSMGPGLFAIFAVLLGVQLVTNDPGHMQGLAWVIWAGNAVVAVLDVILIGRLLRR